MKAAPPPRHFSLKICLAISMGLAVFMLLAPFFWRQGSHKPPPLAWAPGYWENSPLSGAMRVVPVAPSMLVNPAAALAPAEKKDNAAAPARLLP